MPREVRLRRVEAVVISHNEFGEADRLLMLYTREMGKIRTLAKGIRKTHSRKAGHLEPFTCADVLVAKGASFWIISQAETVKEYARIKEDLVKTGLAAYALELLERFTLEEEANAALYRLIKDTLERIHEETDPFSAIRHYELRLLEQVGYRPELFHCVQCRKEIQAEDQFFSAQHGGVVCPRCAPLTSQLRPVSMPALKYLRHFQRSEYEQSRQVKISTLHRSEMEKLMQYYLAVLAERKLNTPDFLRRIRPAQSGIDQATDAGSTEEPAEG